MKTTKHVIRYGEKRSVNYQSIEIAEEVEFMLEEDDDPKVVRNQVLTEIVKRVRENADRAIAKFQ